MNNKEKSRSKKKSNHSLKNYQQTNAEKTTKPFYKLKQIHSAAQMLDKLFCDCAPESTD